ncbi:MAG: GNAT family N-acetyltransferase [Chthoniobacterales bacterium]
MPENLRIEPATLDDLPELVDLLYELFSHERDFTPNRELQQRGLQLIIEEPSRGRIFVLRNKNRIIGMINLLITISTAEGGFVLLLEDLVVAPEFRNCGIGDKLLRHAVEFAKEKKFRRITLLTDKPNDAATRFYLSRGFVESDMIPLRLYLRDS